MGHHVLTLDTPGGAFHESMLLGNGWMGQAVHGQVEQETVELSHIAFYSGCADEDAADPAAPEAFRLARAAAQRGDYVEADRQVERFMGRKEQYGTSMPVGTLTIGQTLGPWRDYRRTLDMDEGVMRLTVTHAGGVQRRECFCSHADQAFLLRVTDDAPMQVRIALGEGAAKAVPWQGGLLLDARALETRHSDGTCGTHLLGFIAVDAGDGEVVRDGDGLMIRGSHDWLLRLTMASDFVLDEDAPRLPDEAWTAQTRARLTGACSLADYVSLLTRHTADFAAQMNRAQLRLTGEGADYAEAMFAFGRYLTVSGARADAPLPMSLQGVWNDNVACRIGWTCDMHLDINTQMNYWLCEQTGLSDSHGPLFSWMEKRLIPHGRRNARRHYGLPGWAAELVSNAWGYAQPYWNRSLSPCPGCGAWLALDLMTHYRRTGDGVFLREQALPMLREAAEFFLAYLFGDGEGRLLGGPSISPENAFVTGEGKAYASNGGTFETSMIRALLEDDLAAHAALQLPEDAHQRQARDALARLPMPRALPDGTLAEWAHDLPPKDPQHRHMSHLVGLYPLRQITPEETPALAEAARESIRRRLDPYDQWEDTGWARNMLTLYSARLKDGEQALFHLMELRRQLTLPSLLVMHPSTRGASSFAPVWELDGNTGVAAAVAEMLLQSRDGMIELLPALPGAWTEGSFAGLMADGPVQVGARWQGGRLTEATLLSPRDVDVTVRCQGRERLCRLKAGQTCTLQM
ncbi:MAG: glycosyl hydrolase family 95 catalytic domain-containing protein [Aristaeellaceae bacterium]